MNGNPYAVPAIVLCAVMLIACILGLLWVSYARRPAEGRHARHPAAEPVPFADPADVTDPDGEEYVGQLHQEQPTGLIEFTGTVDAATLARVRDWWDQEPPPSRVEVLTGPAARIAATSELTLGVLARVRDRLAEMDVSAPPVQEEHPAIDDTGQLPAAVCTWGKTAPELADELAAKYLAAPQ